MINIGANQDVDFIGELRLRRWARENYVAADRRCRDWHDIVLDEMNRKDAEMSIALSAADQGMISEPAYQSRSSYVPLAPTTNERIDTPHRNVAEPNFLSAGSVQAKRDEPMHYQ